MHWRQALRYLVPFLVLLLTSGCVLSSKAPKFAIEEAATPIGAGGQFDTYTKDGDTWKKGEDMLFLTRDGQGYLLSDGKESAPVLFIALKPQWFAVQYRDKPALYYYGLVKTNGDEVESSPLSCDKLKPLVDEATGVSFTNDDCSIEGVANPKAFFTKLIDELPAPTSKLVPHK